MERLKILDLQEVLDDTELTPEGSKKKNREFYHGYYVNLTSQRLQLFKLKGTKCVSCGEEASYAAIELPNGMDYPHINIYGVNKEGKDIMFTKDHIIPKIRGGRNVLENYQVMCQTCNLVKGALEDSEFKNTELTSLLNYKGGPLIDEPFCPCNSHGVSIKLRFHNDEEFIASSWASRMSFGALEYFSRIDNFTKLESMGNYECKLARNHGKGRKLVIIRGNSGWSISLGRVPFGTTKVEALFDESEMELADKEELYYHCRKVEELRTRMDKETFEGVFKCLYL
jgi:hypothetical protein